MTKTRRKREPPLSVRLPKELRLRLIHGAAAAGLTLNAYVVCLLSKVNLPRNRAPRADRQMLALAISALGGIATTLRDTARQDLTPEQDEAFMATMKALRDACNAIMTALGRPGDSS